MKRLSADQLEDRARLASLLVDAAELEHLVLCQYLFAAFSLKRHPEEGGVNWRQLELMRRWEGDLLLIARQEMEHLGLVTNLLTAIGEAPHFARPNFPISSRYYYPVAEPPSLLPFGREILRLLLLLEMPTRVSDQHHQILAIASPSLGQSVHRPDDTLGQLYSEIKALFQALAPAGLFIGPGSAQFTMRQLMPPLLLGVSSPPRAMYDVQIESVTDLDSALAVVRQIVEEGEGTEHDRADSHFGRLVRIYQELSDESADPHFQPARLVGPNPKTAPEAQDGVTVITHPATRRVSQLFDLAYETMLLMLLRYFAHSEESESEIAALQYAVFFPMMTVIIRPLGEILTQLPASADSSDVRAGPSFDIGRRVALLPHPRAARRILSLQLRQMAVLARQIVESNQYAPYILERLSLVHENVARISLSFDDTIDPGHAW